MQTNLIGAYNIDNLLAAIAVGINFEVDRKQIVLNEDAVKEVGEYKAKVKLHQEVQVEVDFNVFAE